MKMNRDEIVEYIEQHRVLNSDIVYDSNGNKESGFYTSSTSAELASNIYKGTHTFNDIENNVTEIWFFGTHIKMGL